ncbi:MAG: 3-oxoadipate enol-lactonase [Sandaracinaceae bacterium]
MGRIAKWTGQGDRLILVHGNAPPDSLAPLIDGLADSFRVGLACRAGYGDEGAAEPASDASRALLAELTAEGIERVHLVGHSYGAYVALRCALDAPERIERLTLLSPLSGVPEDEVPLYEGGAAALRAGDDLTGLLVERWLAPAWVEAHPEVADRVRRWQDDARAALADDIALTAREPDLSHAAAAVSAPTLVRVGALDVATPPDRARSLADTIGARFEQVDGVAHLLALEDVEGTAGSLRAFHGAGSSP